MENKENLWAANPSLLCSESPASQLSLLPPCHRIEDHQIPAPKMRQI
jgi:hypothetical protein